MLIPLLKRISAYALMDSLIAIVVVSMGVLGMVKLQGEILSNNMESQFRIQASLYANELLSMAIADSGNAGCYIVPVTTQSDCGNSTSQAFTQAWETEVNSVFPGTGFSKIVSTISNTNQFTITISWRKKRENLTHNYVMNGQLGL